LPKIEGKLKPFKVRPHWGKLFTFSREYLASIYEKLPDFQKLLKKYDPHGKFRNDFLDNHIFEGINLERHCPEKSKVPSDKV
jgi:alditol oxidase